MSKNIELYKMVSAIIGGDEETAKQHMKNAVEMKSSSILSEAVDPFIAKLISNVVAYGMDNMFMLDELNDEIRKYAFNRYAERMSERQIDRIVQAACTSIRKLYKEQGFSGKPEPQWNGRSAFNSAGEPMMSHKDYERYSRDDEDNGIGGGRF